MSENPYASPTSETFLAEEPKSDAERVRSEHLSHEASVKSIGTVYILGAVFVIPSGLSILVHGIVNIELAESGQTILLALLYLIVGSVQILTAIGLYQFRPWARRLAIALSVIGLIGFPCLTLFSAYFLYLLASSKGKVVFSDEYKGVMAATPHIKYKTSKIALAILLLLLILLGAVVVMVLLGAPF